MDEQNNNTPNDSEREGGPIEEPLAAPPSDGAEPVDSSQSAQDGPIYKKPIFLVGVFAAILALIAIVLVATGSDTDDANTDTNEASQQEQNLQLSAAVAVVEGTVEHSTDGETWTAVSGGETVAVGEYVRTLAESRTVLLLDDGSAIRLDNNSSVQLTAADATISEVMLLSGQVYSRVVESETRTFAVVTDKERFEALGTAYKTSTDEDMDEVEVYQSKVLADINAITVEEGNKYDTESKEKTSIDLDKLKDDDFVQWNKEKDSENEEFKDKLGVLGIEDDEEEEEPPSEPVNNDSAVVPSISLSGQKSDKGVSLSWTLLGGASSSDGFKVVYDKADNTPTYGENSSNYVGPDSLSHTVGVDDGKQYHFRVCIYRASGGSCDTYSNTVTVTAPVVEKEVVEPGAVELGIEGSSIEWGFDGTAPHGFKILLSTEPSPTYPANSIQYKGPGSTSTTLPDNKPAGTYYVRVCKYTADSNIEGGCTDYSNQVEYVVD